MGILFFGLLSLIAFMVFVMGAPLIYYLKREQKWIESGQTVTAWYS